MPLSPAATKRRTSKITALIMTRYNDLSNNTEPQACERVGESIPYFMIKTAMHNLAFNFKYVFALLSLICLWFCAANLVVCSQEIVVL